MPRRTVTIEELAAMDPDAVLIRVPQAFLDALRQDDSDSVWGRFYQWLVQEHGFAPERLHNRTLAGKQLMERLLAAEKRRLSARRHKLRGRNLENALNWSNINSGPQEMVEGRTVVGDGCVVAPPSCMRCGKTIKSGDECGSCGPAARPPAPPP